MGSQFATSRCSGGCHPCDQGPRGETGCRTSMKLEAPTRKDGSIEQITQYPFAQVREKLLMEEKLSPRVVDEAIAEFRKYLELIALGHRGMGMISHEVDEVWHTFILFTRDYVSFCDETFGFFLHHQPAVPSRPLGTEPRQRFLEAYRHEFGDLPAIWGTQLDSCITCTPPSTNCQDPKCR